MPPCRVGDRPEKYEPGEWTDEDTVRAVAWISEAVDLDVGVETVDRAVIAVARKRTVHAVRDYLHGLTWDRTDRVSNWLTAYVGAEDSPYMRAIGKAWMVSAIARVEKPGAQVDHLVIFEGPQAAGKSSALRILGGAWLNESPIEITDAREAGQALRGFWIVVFDELDSLKRAEARRVKAFLTLTSDTYRASYGRRTRSYARQCVFAATTNEAAYLVDSTGNRRFWPVRVGKIDLAALRRDRDQLWAEARALYEQGEPWHITDATVERLARAEQTEREEEDPWTATIQSWLDEHGKKYPSGVTTDDVLRRALSLDVRDLTITNASRAGTLLRKLGWLPRQRRENGERVRRYLSQPLSGGCDGGRDTSDPKKPGESHVTACHTTHIRARERGDRA